MNVKRGIISRLTLRKDSFELIYAFAPQSFVANVNRSEHTVAGKYVNTDGNKSGSWMPNGSAVKVYKGAWQIEDSYEFRKNGWDFPVVEMSDMKPDTVMLSNQHLTFEDGDRVVFTFPDGSRKPGVVSLTYYPVPAVFLDNTLSEVYTKQADPATQNSPAANH